MALAELDGAEAVRAAYLSLEWTDFAESVAADHGAALLAEGFLQFTDGLRQHAQNMLRSYHDATEPEYAQPERQSC